ncbi:MAG: TA system VapC family ribonuclease toxin [Nitriliruptor sp.]|uniref:TA system VapC family ribonuclease toxin n=1 Tax=Nitriliruptor sp. TaxID=2448056 RepID=UPI0034A0A7C0
MWLALSLSGHGHHRTARRWLETVEAPSAIHFCRATQQTLLRLLTIAAVLAPYGNRPLTNDEAWSVYAQLLDDDRITFRGLEPPGLEAVWARFARRDTASPKLWMDSYLAAFALAGDLTLVTTDNAFRQFDGLDLLVLS